MSVFGSTFTYAFTYAVCSLYLVVQGQSHSESMVSVVSVVFQKLFLSPSSPALLGIVRNRVCTPLHSSHQLTAHASRVVSRCLSADLLAVLVVVGRFLIANGKALEEEETLRNSKETIQQLNTCRSARHQLICTSSKASKGSRL